MVCRPTLERPLHSALECPRLIGSQEHIPTTTHIVEVGVTRLLAWIHEVGLQHCTPEEAMAS